MVATVVKRKQCVFQTNLGFFMIINDYFNKIHVMKCNKSFVVIAINLKILNNVSKSQAIISGFQDFKVQG